MNNLSYFRSISGLKPRMLSKLLNITAHTYIAFEQDKMDAPYEILKMVGLLYDINYEELSVDAKSVSEQTIDKLKIISALDDEAKLNYCSEKLLGKHTSLNYRNVRAIKEKIVKSKNEQ